jgi:hypothetical protein
MTAGFRAQSLPEDPGRRRGDAAASRLWRARAPRTGRNTPKADTSRRSQAASNKKNLGLIRHDGIPRHQRSDYGIVPELPVRWAS